MIGTPIGKRLGHPESYVRNGTNEEIGTDRGNLMSSNARDAGETPCIYGTHVLCIEPHCICDCHDEENPA